MRNRPKIVWHDCLARLSGTIVWNDQETPILEQMRTLRERSEQQRARITQDLALQIRKLPATPNETRFANGPANLATEGDLEHDTLQEAATTLAAALHEQPVPADSKGPPMPYVELAPDRRSLGDALRGEFLSML